MLNDKFLLFLLIEVGVVVGVWWVGFIYFNGKLRIRQWWDTRFERRARKREARGIDVNVEECDLTMVIDDGTTYTEHVVGRAGAMWEGEPVVHSATNIARYEKANGNGSIKIVEDTGEVKIIPRHRVKYYRIENITEKIVRVYR